jgi:LmbE family N-acetylglucosaminyl deacetylase
MWGTEDPDEFIDITDSIDLKIEALKKHVSQVSGGDRDVADFVKARAQTIGQRVEVPYAEGFRRIQFRR